MYSFINDTVEQYIFDLQRAFGDEIDRVYLYGYHASDFPINKDAAIHLLILTELERNEIDKHMLLFSALTNSCNLKNDVLIIPLLINSQCFMQWVDSNPFYDHILREGVLFYDSKR